MTITLNAMAAYLSKHNPNLRIPGRKTAHLISDVIAQGLGRVLKEPPTIDDNLQDKGATYAPEPEDYGVDT